MGAARVIWPIALPYLLIALAERLPFRKLEQIGDFSYGIYIYAFLIQQCLFAFGWQRQGFWIFLGLSLGLSVAAVYRARFGLLTGCFLIGYGIARIIGECFRQPDAFLGFLWSGVTMGQVLSLPMIIVGLGLVFYARLRSPRLTGAFAA